MAPLRNRMDNVVASRCTLQSINVGYVAEVLLIVNFINEGV